MVDEFKKRTTDFVSKFNSKVSSSKGFPEPEEKTEIATILKKHGQIEIQVMVHIRSKARYGMIAVYELDGEVMNLTRWLALNGLEIKPVMGALMDGYEMIHNMERTESGKVTLPHTLLTLPRKAGARELRVMLEEYNGRYSFKLRVFQKEGDRWGWAEEWAWLLPQDLGEMISALEKVDEAITASATEI